MAAKDEQPYRLPSTTITERYLPYMESDAPREAALQVLVNLQLVSGMGNLVIETNCKLFPSSPCWHKLNLSIKAFPNLSVQPAPTVGT